MSPRARRIVRWAGLACLALALLPTWARTGGEGAGESRWSIRIGVPVSPGVVWSIERGDRRTELPGGGFSVDLSTRSAVSLHPLSGSGALLLAAALLGRLLRRFPARPDPSPPFAASPPPPPAPPAAT